ncbi:MAG: pantoate--beta-alanine ligase [Saprospiraceae bacterium]|jgi:pantoate--beta-alanine ligase
MFLFKKVVDLQKYLNIKRKKGDSIGLVPTMGALHVGHLSLIRQSMAQNDITVACIFVNPTQFNEEGDLKKYPRTIGADIDLLTTVDTDVLFLPNVDEVYPPDLDTSLNLDFGDLGQVMEGKFRPGHFDGMAQVVWRLLKITEPDKLYMGQKDFQQQAIVRNMLEQMQSDVELIMCPIVREEDGLAMSSRNLRLDPAHRSGATIINDTLHKAKAMIGEKSPMEVSEWALQVLQQPGFKPEYFDIVDGIQLRKINNFEDADLVVACTAVWAGEVRLIDNLILKDNL